MKHPLEHDFDAGLAWLDGGPAALRIDARIARWQQRAESVFAQGLRGHVFGFECSSTSHAALVGWLVSAATVSNGLAQEDIADGFLAIAETAFKATRAALHEELLDMRLVRLVTARAESPNRRRLAFEATTWPLVAYAEHVLTRRQEGALVDGMIAGGLMSAQLRASSRLSADHAMPRELALSFFKGCITPAIQRHNVAVGGVQ